MRVKILLRINDPPWAATIAVGVEELKTRIQLSFHAHLRDGDASF